MLEADLETAHQILEAAFGGLIESNTGRRPAEPRFSSVLERYRLALDPAGCHVAEHNGELIGVNFSVLRGTLGWFGPLAVRPDVQRQGVAQRLVAECLRSFDERRARLVGLETMAASAQHIHLYQKLGFRSSWIGVNYRGAVRANRMPGWARLDASTPRLDYVFPGFDATQDAVVTRRQKVGATVTVGDGFAICHTTNTLFASPGVAYVPVLAARDRDTFEQLMQAVEALAGEAGRSEVVVQVPGSSWHTQQALLERGYQPGGAALRMKRGDDLDYDAGSFYYCDDWH